LKHSVGDRFALLLYRAVLDRWRWPVGWLAALLAGLWTLAARDWVGWPGPQHGPWLFASAVVAAACWLVLTIGRRLAYVQPRRDHLRLQTPFLRLKIAYQRIERTRPVQIAKAFPAADLSAAEQRLLAPFAAMTALAIDLRGLPLPSWLLRLFLHRRFMSSDQVGLVLIIADWMALSEQISDHMEMRRDDQGQAQAQAYSDAARILSENPFDRR
jgi:hypothetical protein